MKLRTIGKLQAGENGMENWRHVTEYAETRHWNNLKVLLVKIAIYVIQFQAFVNGFKSVYDVSIL